METGREIGIEKQEEDIEEKKKKTFEKAAQFKNTAVEASRRLPAVFYGWTAMPLGRPDFAYRK